MDNASDITTESAGGGTVLVQASVTYTLAAEVENLTLTGSSGLNGAGNALNNTLTGNTGNNTLTGLAGNDWLDGGRLTWDQGIDQQPQDVRIFSPPAGTRIG